MPAARAKHSANSDKLAQIGADRVESTFGGFEARRDLANAELGLELSNAAIDVSVGAVLTYAGGVGASYQYARIANRARSLYNITRSAASINRAARVASSAERLSRNLRVLGELGVGVSYSFALASDSNDFGTSSAVDFIEFGQPANLSTGLWINVTQAGINRINASGLSSSEVQGVLSNIASSLGRTQASLHGQLDADLKACDEKHSGK